MKRPPRASTSFIAEQADIEVSHCAPDPRTGTPAGSSAAPVPGASPEDTSPASAPVNPGRASAARELSPSAVVCCGPPTAVPRGGVRCSDAPNARSVTGEMRSNAYSITIHDRCGRLVLQGGRRKQRRLPYGQVNQRFCHATPRMWLASRGIGRPESN
ncbi:hypothetical protein DVS28_a1710 [Euzebya pacifica]|uniref:Uncharacterized protein n=1 Tax=Euzebya pacifica TaxID=1608957 RepID=A0A346XW04_9ACTN|nr:hypothetical protein DVS28_a1710 [Euzebya pacifica]